MAGRKKKSDFLSKFLIFLSLVLFGFMLGGNLNEIKNAKMISWMGRGSLSGTISPKELEKKLQDKDFVLINVHTPYEGEIAKTDTFIEYDSIKANTARLPADKNAKIVLYCKSGNMSSQALKTLKSMGYTNVYHLSGGMDAWKKAGYEILDLSDLPNQVLPEEGFVLPVSWGDIATRLIELGVIDKTKFEKAVIMGEAEKAVFEGKSDTPIRIDSKNSQFVVDLLWALGLAQKSLVYDKGPMGTRYKNEAGNFASTGGWNLAVGSAMNYYNKFELIGLSEDEQQRVYDIASNIYRPCCGNHTAFPDCNHGMAALAAIELMVKKGLSDDEIYKNILKLNSFWFPSNYLTVATYFARQGINWDKVDAKKVLGSNFSSGQGAAKIAKEVGPLPFETRYGGSCGA
jgi:rhodanese-related sulfurtransferase